jgi:GNAT superfamily N-acetyltransferase
MFAYDLELLSADHDRKAFRCGKESLEIYLRETAKGHLNKGISITRVLVESSTIGPKPILGYFTLTTILIEAANWPGTAKGLPALPVPVILLGRLAVAETWQRRGIAALLLAAARQISATSLKGTGGIGLAVDAAEEALVPFYQKYGFKRISDSSLRLFLPTRSLG